MSMPGPQFADAPAYADAAAEYGGFDVRRAVELDEQGLIGRLAFAGIYALLALAVMPWPIPAMWIGSLIVWELLSPRLFTPWMRGLDDEGALADFFQSGGQGEDRDEVWRCLGGTGLRPVQFGVPPNCGWVNGRIRRLG